MKAKITRLHFLRALFARFYREHHGYVLVQTSHGPDADSKNRHFLDINTLAEEPYGAEKDVLFGVCPRSTMRGHDEDIGHVVALWADLDVGLQGHESKASFFSSVGHLTAAVKAFPVKPSIVVESGRGAHLYWVLNQGRDSEEFERIEEIQRAIAGRFGCDMDANLSALLRLPKTVNNKVPGRPTYCDVRYINFDARYPLEAFENLERRIARTAMKKFAVNRKDPSGLPEIDLTRIPGLSGFDFGDESHFRNDSFGEMFDGQKAGTNRDSGAEILLEISSENLYVDHDPTSPIDHDMYELPGQPIESSVDGSPTIELTQEAINEVLDHVQSAVLGSQESDDAAAVELVVDPPAEAQSTLSMDLPDPTVEDEIDLTGYRSEVYTGYDLESYEEIPASAPIEIESESEILLGSTQGAESSNSYARATPVDYDVPASEAFDDLYGSDPTDNSDTRKRRANIEQDSYEYGQFSFQDAFLAGEEKGFMEAPSVELMPMAQISDYAGENDEILLDAGEGNQSGEYLRDDYFRPQVAPGEIYRAGDEDYAEIDLTVSTEEISEIIRLPQPQTTASATGAVIPQASSHAGALVSEFKSMNTPATDFQSAPQFTNQFLKTHEPDYPSTPPSTPMHSSGRHNIRLKRIERLLRTRPVRLKKPHPRPHCRRKHSRQRRHRLSSRHIAP